MQKITFLLALFGAILSLYAVTHSGGNGSPQKAETVAERVLRTGTIRCGYNTWPRYLEKVDDQKFTGFNYDLMMEIGKRLSLNIEWTEEAPWDAALTGITSGRYDMFCFPLYINAGRALATVFSTPIAYLPAYVFMRADDTRYDGTNLSKLNDPQFTMSFIEGDISGILANRLFPNAKKDALSQTQGAIMIIRDIAAKKSDFTVTEKSFVDDYNAKNSPKLKSVGSPVFSNPFAYALPNDLQFKSMIDSAIIELQQDGSIEQIYKKNGYDTYVLLPATPYREK